MNNETVTIKVWTETRKLLRLISATTDESILEVAHRVIKQEWERLKHDQGTQDPPKSNA